ncbi:MULTISPECIES: hypothetical protein [unclassified Moorena]|uniref:hypothetical protein n=1 Tax=unclassified Moorena TaxID=2683338 RepID=UPI0013BA85D4|nr:MULTISPECIES: hypothetical protein [unclassified Moorena]NEQ06915.1 hypothetical protein [Moorena sp. SIO4E2]NEQ15487.1 hypothetical protein [Moorena sp. SIO3E2]NER90184.1 hypothetical protein [Moorena sp. SIO3A2]
MGETPKTALAPQDRAASLESFIPPKIGGLGGRIIPINLPCQTYFCSRFPTPDSRLPTPSKF